jgi:ankyrin repeat protein
MYRDSNNMTALHYATQRGFDECVQVLQKLATQPPTARPVSGRA